MGLTGGVAERAGRRVDSIEVAMSSQTAIAPRPLLRGYLHLIAAVAAPYALVFLVLAADSPRGVVGGALFGASLVILYSTSAVYHVLPMGRRLRGLVRRADHSNIFLFIAGAYAPFALKLMSNPWGIPFLSVVGGLALVGLIVTMSAPSAPRWFRVGLYLALGWIGLVAISELIAALPLRGFALLVLSGVLFSAGGAMYAARRPDPFPRVFGYHEVFHALQLAATAVIYLVVVVYVLG